MKLGKKVLAVLFALMLLCGSLTACNMYPSYEIFDMVLWLPYVGDNASSYMQELLTNEIPSLQGTEVVIFTQSIGYEASNPSEYNLYAMKLQAMASCGEADMIIMSKDDASGHARGGMFMSLDEIFTPEELKALEGRLLDFPEYDVDGNELETRTPYCGIDISDNQALAEALGTDDLGLYAVIDMGHPERIKEIFNYFIPQ